MLSEIQALGPALAMVEPCDIPSGLVALDALAKEAPVVVVGAGTIHHGHFLIVFAGSVAEVEMSYARAIERTERLRMSLRDNVGHCRTSS